MGKFNTAKQFISQIFKPQKTTGTEVVTSVKANPQTRRVN